MERWLLRWKIGTELRVQLAVGPNELIDEHRLAQAAVAKRFGIPVKGGILDLSGDQEKSVPHCWGGVSSPSGALRRFEFFAWWRRGESNPRPKILYSGPLRAFPVVLVSSPGTPAGRVPFGPSREKARLRPPGRRLQAIP